MPGEPERPDYSTGPDYRRRYGSRGVIRSYVDGRVQDTGPLNRKRMETTDEETTAAWGAPEGVRLYPDPPRLEDRTDRGQLRALRSDQVTYLPQRPGPVTLPGMPIFWLEPGSSQPRDLSVPPLAFEVLPAVKAGGRARLPWALIVPCVAALLLGGGVLVWRLHRAAADIPGRAAFAALAAACRANDAPASMAALFRWLADATPPGRTGDAATLASLTGTPGLAAEATALQCHLYSGDVSPSW